MKRSIGRNGTASAEAGADRSDDGAVSRDAWHDLPSTDRPIDVPLAVQTAINSLPPGTRQQVEAICAKYQIPDARVGRVLWWAHRIRHFRANQDHLAPSRRKRHAGVEEVARYANLLQDALSRLHVDDQVAILGHLADSGLDENHGVETSLSILHWASTVRAAEIKAEGPFSGRPATSPHLAAFVGALWDATDGIAPEAPKAVFERFCEEIFAAAGARSGAEGPVALFFEELRKR
jgi:hypothetical protein